MRTASSAPIDGEQSPPPSVVSVSQWTVAGMVCVALWVVEWGGTYDHLLAGELAQDLARPHRPGGHGGRHAQDVRPVFPLPFSQARPSLSRSMRR